MIKSLAKRFERVENATALIRKLLLVVEQQFRRLNAPHLRGGSTLASRTTTANVSPRYPTLVSASPPDARLHTS